MSLKLNGIEVRDWLVFDPGDVDRLFAQDEAFAAGYTVDLKVESARWLSRLSQEHKKERVYDLRQAAKLPLGWQMQEIIATELKIVLESMRESSPYFRR